MNLHEIKAAAIEVGARIRIMPNRGNLVREIWNKRGTIVARRENDLWVVKLDKPENIFYWGVTDEVHVRTNEVVLT